MREIVLNGKRMAGYASAITRQEIIDGKVDVLHLGERAEVHSPKGLLRRVNDLGIRLRVPPETTPREKGCMEDCRGGYDEGGFACLHYGNCYK